MQNRLFFNFFNMYEPVPIQPKSSLKVGADYLGDLKNNKKKSLYQKDIQ